MLEKFLIALIILLMPMTASAKSQDLWIYGDHGRLAAVLQTPDGQSKYPLVMILHGFTGNKNEELLKNIADNLEAAGIASMRFDFNGHGQSDGAFEDMTVPNEIVDAKKVLAYIDKLPNVTAVGITGHSQGGVITSMLAGELGAKKIKCIVLMAPAPILRDDSLRGKLFNIEYDPKNPPEYIDFNGHKVGRNYFLTAQTLPIFEVAKKFTGSVLMIHATGDTISPYTYSSDYYNDIYKRGTVELIDGSDHGFTGNKSHVAELAAKFFISHMKK